MNQESARVEQTPIAHQGALELGPRDIQEVNPENQSADGLETGAERVEQASEAVAIAVNNAGLPTMLPAPSTTDAVEASAELSLDVASPATAGDDDLIEKEWVERAKKIVDENKDDPYAQERAVYALQQDYRKKRGLDHTAA